MGVIASGSYALCGIGETTPALVFGHAAQKSLKEVWDNTAVLQELRDGFPHRLKGVCGDCVMKNRCLGSCVAQNYYSEKDLWAPFWYCKEEHAYGLFPASRHIEGGGKRPSVLKGRRFTAEGAEDAEKLREGEGA